MTGNGNDGELVNGPEWVDGLYGEALEFNGTNAYVSVMQPVDLPAGSDPRSVMLSFKWDAVKWPPPGIEPMGYGTNSPGLRFGVWIDAGKAVGVETVGFGVVTPWDGDTDWHHLAITYPEGETMADQFTVYFDGEPGDGDLIGAAPPLNTSPGPLTIGVLPTPLVYYFNGIIDDVAIFPEELSAGDIRAIATRGLENARAVSPSGKLATSWGILKSP